MITAGMVKELREKTGAGMMDCKNALNEAKEDMAKALVILREKGLSTAVKKAERTTAEGLIAAYVSEDKKSGSMVEVNCETDFVSANKEFIDLAENIAKQTAKTNTQSVEDLINEKYIADESISIKDAVARLITKFGENIRLKRFKRFSIESGIIIGYIHNFGRIGALSQISCDNDSPVLEDTGKELIMQIAAANPLYLDRNDIDKETLYKLEQSFKTDALASGKAQNIIDKIVLGKLNKYYKENCLLEQSWIKNEDISISMYLSEASEKIGAPVKVAGFARFERGGV